MPCPLCLTAFAQTAEITTKDAPVIFKSTSNLIPVTVVVRDGQGHTAGDPDRTGAWSDGEFSSTLWAIFSPASEGLNYAPAYGGEIWIDKDTSRVLRVEMAALPAHSEALYCQRGGTACSRNITDFQNYKQYSADATITFEETPQ